MSEHSVKSKRPYLDKDEGWLLGVCAGLARYLSLDIAVVRVISAIVALFTPKIAIAVYLVAWLVMDNKVKREWLDKDRWKTRDRY